MDERLTISRATLAIWSATFHSFIHSNLASCFRKSSVSGVRGVMSRCLMRRSLSSCTVSLQTHMAPVPPLQRTCAKLFLVTTPSAQGTLTRLVSTSFRFPLTFWTRLAFRHLKTTCSTEPGRNTDRNQIRLQPRSNIHAPVTSRRSKMDRFMAEATQFSRTSIPTGPRKAQSTAPLHPLTDQSTLQPYLLEKRLESSTKGGTYFADRISLCFRRE